MKEQTLLLFSIISPQGYFEMLYVIHIFFEYTFTFMPHSRVTVHKQNEIKRV